MRLILFRFAIFAAALVIVWLLAGSRISMWLDRVGTINDKTLPVGNYELDRHQFIIGAKRWILDGNAVIGRDEHDHVILSSGGRTFSFGLVDSGRATLPDPYFRFHLDPGDTISFVQSYGALAWPTPFHFSIMGPKPSTWERHSYRQLIWRKQFGASITICWPDIQSFFAATGWTDGNLEIPPKIIISKMPDERAIVAYLAKSKYWQRAEYRLEHRPPSQDGSFNIIAVTQLVDSRAGRPGAAQTVRLLIDRRTHIVSAETALQ